jgi:hypothetical protein
MLDWLAQHAWTPEVFVSLVAAMFAAAAWVTSRKALLASYQPIVRVIPARGTFGTRPEVVILKNIGRGAAVSITVVRRNGDDRTVIAELDALEPLGETFGPDFKESSRVGRQEVWVRHPNTLEMNTRYRVLYQDTTGGWHETEFTPIDAGFRVRALGSRQPEQIPGWVHDRAQIVTGI